MADKNPAYFYHPVIGALSPVTLGAYIKNKAESKPFNYSISPPSHTQTRIRKPMSLLKTAICAVTGEVLPINQMIRFVISPDSIVVPDINNKLPGNFIWVKAERNIIQKAIWRNTFATHSRQNVNIPDNLLDVLENNLNKHAMNTISMCRRAGELTFGFTKSEETLRAGQVAVYVVASNAKDNGREKLERLAIHQNITVLDIWSSDMLSSAIGEENVMHIMLAHGGLAQNLLEIKTKLKAIARTKS